MIDETAYRSWWQLHVRIARGETVSPQQRALYDELRRKLEKDEAFPSLAQAQEARGELNELEAERVQLQQRREHLDREIANLERRLAPQARQLLKSTQ